MTSPSRADPGWTSPARLADPFPPPVVDAGGRVRDPLLLIDLDAAADPGTVAAAVAAAAGSDRVLVGVAVGGAPGPELLPLVRALDLTLVPAGGGPAGRETVAVADPAGEAALLRSIADEHAAASVVLAGLLRWSGSLPVPAALDAESLAYSTLLGGEDFRRWLAGRGPRPLPPPPSADPVLVRRNGNRLAIRLNRPERRNAYGRDLRDALTAALAVAEADPSIDAVLLDGAGPGFSSGGDLDEFGTTPDPVTAHLVRTRGGAGRQLARLADRTVARIHGPCVGAGIELPAFAGRVVAAPGSTLRLPEIAMGLIPGAGGTVSIPRRIGRWRTLHLALSGAALDTDTALAWGLVDEVR
jgi:hypothetical protein